MLVRTFIAIHLTQEILGELRTLSEQLQRRPGGRAGRWVAADNIHLTLKFLGDVPSENLDAIGEAVQRASAQSVPFELTIAGLGCFPSPRRPRVVWAGIQDATNGLQKLQQLIEEELASLGYEREEREFSPHLTLARAKRRARPRDVAALGRTVANHEPIELGHMVVDSVSVIKSDLQPGGAVYTDLYTARLAASGDR